MRVDRLDKGHPIKPTVSVEPGEGRLHEGSRKENLYGSGQKVLSKKYKEGYDGIKWETEEDPVD